MSPLASTILSGAFLLVGAAAVYSMMKMRGAKEVSHARLYVNIHKAAGWAFVGLFIIMFVLMIGRVGEFWEETSARVNSHIVLAVTLLVILATKISIPRFFPKLGKNMFSLGISVYVLGFTLVTITGGYYIIRSIQNTPYLTHRDLPEHILDETLGKELFISKCSICHILGDIMQPRSAENWENVVNEMVELSQPRIKVNQGIQILHYLTLTHTPETEDIAAQATPVERHCLACHEKKEIYAERYSQTAWREIVVKMHEYDAELVPLAKVDEIVDYLLVNQRIKE